MPRARLRVIAAAAGRGADAPSECALFEGATKAVRDILRSLGYIGR